MGEDLKNLKNLKDNLEKKVKEAGEKVDDVVSKAENEVDEAKEKVDKLTEPGLNKLSDSAKEEATEVTNKVTEAATDVQEDAKDLLDEAENGIKSAEKELEVAKSDSGAGDSEGEGKGEEENMKNSELALLAVAPSIAAGGTVFATTSKRKVSRKGVPAHLRNVRSKLSKTFHENERYNLDSGKEEEDSGVEDSQNSSISKKSPGRSDSPVKRASRLNRMAGAFHEVGPFQKALSLSQTHLRPHLPKQPKEFL